MTDIVERLKELWNKIKSRLAPTVNFIVKSLKNLWNEIEPILIHTIVSLTFFIPVIFFYFKIKDSLVEPFKTITGNLALLFFTCSLGLYLFLAFGIAYKFIGEKWKKWKKARNNPVAPAPQPPNKRYYLRHRRLLAKLRKRSLNKP